MHESSFNIQIDERYRPISILHQYDLGLFWVEYLGQLQDN